MPTPQIAAAAPSKDCPICGRRMQLLATTPSTYQYVCYAHSPGQNADSSDPYYLNVHHSVKYNPDGTIATPPKAKEDK